MSDPREEALKAAGLPERLAPLLQGDGETELQANARRLGEDLGIQPKDPRSFETNLLAQLALKNAAMNRAMFGITEEEK